MANIAAPIDFNFMTIVVILNLVMNTKITNKCHIGKTVVKYLRLSLMRKRMKSMRNLNCLAKI